MKITRMLLGMALALCMLLSCALAETSNVAASTRGFATEEECVTAVSEALIQGDVQAFLDCYAIPEVARRFDMAASIEALQCVMPIASTLLPPTSSFAIASNEAKLTSDLLRRLMGAALLLHDSGDAQSDFVSGMPLPAKDHTMEEMLALTDAGDVLTRLRYQGTTPIPQEVLNKTYVKMTARNKSLYGMTAWSETIALLDLDGQAVYLPLALVRYEDGWLVAPFSSFVANFYGMPSYTLMMAADALQTR